MKVYFFGGKGGVGKTTVSSSFAVKVSEKGKKTLLISTDPAHSLSDVFNKKIEGEKKLSENLTAVEIDVYGEIKTYKERVIESSKAFLSKEVLKSLEEILENLEASPGIEDVVILEALSRIITQRWKKYDVFVVDTAPTGHTLGLLKTVGKLSNALEEIIKIKEKIEEFRYRAGKEKRVKAIEIIKERKRRFSKFSEIIYNYSVFIPVLIPEKLPLEETLRLVNSLISIGIKVEKVIVNRILPENPKDEFLKRRKEIEKKYVEEIEERLKGIEKIYIPLLEEEVVGYEKLKNFANFLEV